MHIGSTLANVAWISACLPRLGRFRRALARPAEVQQCLLAGYLRDNAETKYGRKFEFRRLGSIREYQAAVPLTTYEDYVSYIDELRAGQTSVLTTAPVRRLIPTSGSTSARKLIPYTDRLLHEINRAIAPWVANLYIRDPWLAIGAAYWSISPVIGQGESQASTVPIGFDEDSAYLGGVGKRLVDATLAVPSSVRFIEDIEAFRYVTLLHLLRRRDLRLISVWHPSFLTLLLEQLPQHWPDLIGDIERGVARPPGGLPEGIRCRRHRGDRRRARELARLDPNDPARIWPGLRLISCWGDGHAEMYLSALHTFFPGACIQPKGLIATEGIVTLPLGAARPLAVTSHFFEFLGDDGTVYLAEELEIGGEYSVVLTTGGGLYRYRLGDLVRVTGRLERTPSLIFVGREGGISDRFGEKLSEGFVASVLRDLFGRHDLKPAFALLAPNTDGARWWYSLFVGLPQAPPATLAGDLEKALRENPHYRYCVDLGQLGPATVCLTPPNAFERYVDDLARRGRRPGDIKPSPLATEPVNLTDRSGAHERRPQAVSLG